MAEPASGSLLEAMLAVQAAAPTLKKSAENPHYRSKFAPLDEIVETIGPILNNNGLIWTTLPGRDQHGDPALRYRLIHAPTGEALDGEMPLLLSQANAQGQGSAITYARRYALCAVLNLVADDDDDGARAATGQQQRQYGQADAAWKTEPASKAQLSKLKGLITQNRLGGDVVRALLKGVRFELEDGEKVNDALPRLSKGQCSALIDEIQKGAVPTGESDVPGAQPGEFEHPELSEEDRQLLEGSEPS